MVINVDVSFVVINVKWYKRRCQLNLNCWGFCFRGCRLSVIPFDNGASQTIKCNYEPESSNYIFSIRQGQLLLTNMRKKHFSSYVHLYKLVAKTHCCDQKITITIIIVTN